MPVFCTECDPDFMSAAASGLVSGYQPPLLAELGEPTGWNALSAFASIGVA